MKLFQLFSLLLLVFCVSSMSWSAPIPYSGKLSKDGINFNGKAFFVFEINDSNGTVRWRNGSNGTDSIQVTVENGRYLVLLGGQGMNTLAPQLFLDHDELYLNVLADLQDGQGLKKLGPEQRITSNAYAKVAELSRFALNAGHAESLSPNSVEPLHFNETIKEYLKPIITSQPQPIIPTEGQPIDLNATAEGRFLQYQWKRYGQPIAGETNSSLNIPSFAAGNFEGNYTLEVFNAFGKTESQTVELLLARNETWKFDFNSTWIRKAPTGGYLLDNGLRGLRKINEFGHTIWSNDLQSSISYHGWDEDNTSQPGNPSVGQFEHFNITSDASIVVIGGTATSDSDYGVTKLNQTGVILWEKTFGGISHEYPWDIFETSDGNYVIAGESNSSISGDKSENSRGGVDFWILKIDSNGNKIWDKTFGGNGVDAAWAIIESSDGNYVIAGESNSSISGDKSGNSRGGVDFWILKIDSNGNKIWDKTFGGDGDEWISWAFTVFEQTSDNGFLVHGFTDSNVSGDITNGIIDNSMTEEPILIKLDSNGEKTWDKRFGVANFTQLTGGAEATTSFAVYNEFIYFAHITARNSNELFVLDLYKMNNAGDLIWKKELPHTVENGDSLLIDMSVSESGILISSSDGWVLKLDTEGNP